MNSREIGEGRPRDEVEALDILAGIVGEAGRSEVVKSIGDDCAVISLGDCDVLLTVDAAVSGVHFNLRWQSAYSVGWRALAAAASDIAAMAGEPVVGLVSLGLERGWDERVGDIYRGMRDLGERLRMDIVGGDIIRIPKGLSISVTVVGKVEKGRAVFRGGSRQGDEIWVTGRLGLGGALRLMERDGIRDRRWDSLLDSYGKITPRVEEARFLAGNLALSGMIDISDGLSTDLAHLCRSSGVGAVVEAERVPVDESAQGVADCLGMDPFDIAVNGGEDFELCFTVPAGEGDSVTGSFLERFGLPMTRIGSITGSGLLVRDGGGAERDLVIGGFDHLKTGEG
jgi:thiamine-monophosphate kinase